MARKIAPALAVEWAGAEATERIAVAERHLAVNPRCAMGRYLAGCSAFDLGRPAVATRHMMICHHLEARFESAALLAFCGLTWCSRPSSPMLRVLLDTWVDYRRPEFDRTRIEGGFLDALSGRENPSGDLTPLARRLLRLPIETLRRQLRTAVASADPVYAGLLWASPSTLASPSPGAVGSGA